jgi:hypothetical protein
MDEELWPRPGDTLFAPDSDSENNACVGWSSDHWHGYMEGYRRAAERLVQHVVETGRDLDYFVYPVAFLYRHAIELALKFLQARGQLLLGQQPTASAHHGLASLWTECRRLIDKVWPNHPKDELDAAESVIRQLDLKDGRSTTFRYPTTKEGHSSLPDGELINLRNLAEVANRTFNLLDCVSIEFDRYFQDREDGP